MKKAISLVMAVMFMFSAVNAQSVNDGIKFIAYQKTKSAINV